MAHRALVISFIALLIVGFGAAGFAQDKHPEITAAIKSLDEANKHLDKAGSGFGGNKVKAQTLIKQAQKELKDALSFAAGGKSLEEKPKSATQSTDKK